MPNRSTSDKLLGADAHGAADGSRLLAQQGALAALARSEVFAGQDMLAAVRLLTRTAAREMPAERISVWRLDGDRESLVCINRYDAGADRHTGEDDPDCQPLRQHLDDLLAVNTGASGKPLQACHTGAGCGVQSTSQALNAPIHFFGRCEGVVRFERDGAAPPWTADQSFFAVAVANLLAMALGQGERAKAETLLRGQKDVLESIANGEPLPETLVRLIHLVEQQEQGLIASILIVDDDGRTLRLGAAPSLPDDYNQAVDKLPIGPDMGCCGTSAYTGQESIAADIASDPRWSSFKDLAARAGLRACWSTPIFDSTRTVVGTFAIYYRDAHGPLPRHIPLIDMATQVAAIAIERSRTERRVQRLAFFDALTRLPNRVLFQDRAGQALALAARHAKPTALLFIDLDRFKSINDSLGHHVGDLLLQSVARRLSSCMRAGDTVARLGGDEFVALLPETDQDGAAHASEKILQILGQPHQLNEHRQTITPSVGIAMFPEDGNSVETLIKHADIAMYHAKQRGRNAYEFFVGDMNVRAVKRHSIENGLRRALEQEEFLLHYQPQYDIETRRLVGMEALIRWQPADSANFVSPVEFIPVAEETGLIVHIGEWVLSEACRQNRFWQAIGLPKVPVAVNIAAPQFRGDLHKVIARVLDESGLEPGYLELELTERIVMEGDAPIQNRLAKLKDMGLALALDDFGTGYSSLSYLKRFPIDKLKIDQGFVRDIIDDPGDLAISRAVIGLGRGLGLTVIAEGVETAEHLAILRDEGCDQVQGYFLSRPLDADKFEALLRREMENPGGIIA